MSLYFACIHLFNLVCVRASRGRRVLIADSWFGSVACALELRRRNVFAAMNVKTGTRGYPKAALMSVVGEIKGASAEAKRRRRAVRGKQMAFTKEFVVGGKKVSVIAGAHNKKLPLLLVATASTMLPGGEHVKRWTTRNAENAEEVHQLVTPQPQMHELYRVHMNHVDLHNKLRQGQCSMANVWKTNSWANRHFAEMLGFTEVNIYKCLLYFIKGQWLNTSHNDFRRRLAWAFLTLGKEVFPDDAGATSGFSGSSTSSGTISTWTPSVVGSASALYTGPQCHHYQTFKRTGFKDEKHTCGYCGSRTTKFCGTCLENGYGVIAVCGRKSMRGCMDKHQGGAALTHGSWRAGKSKRARAGSPIPSVHDSE